MGDKDSKGKNIEKLPIYQKEQILYQGKTFEVIKEFWQIEKNNVPQILGHEMVRRSPGVRVLLNNNNKILLIKEYRYEYSDWDYRLPGGKVFDTLNKYKKTLKEDSDIFSFAKIAAKKELIEETGFLAKEISLMEKTRAGGTVVWDLYYFEVINFESSNFMKNPELGEIIHIFWADLPLVEKMCLDGRIKEDRTVGVLLKYLLKRHKNEN